MKTERMIAALTLGIFLSFAGQAAADYSFTTLDPPGSIRTETQGINSCGDIVGFYEDATHIVHGFLLRDPNASCCTSTKYREAQKRVADWCQGSEFEREYTFF